MEQDMTTAMPQMDMGGAPQQKSGKGLKIATALMAIIALCGIGFGVFGMMQSQKKDDLKVQIKNADGTATSLETEKIETTNENGSTTVTIADSNIKKSNPIISAQAPLSYAIGFTSSVLSYGEEGSFFLNLSVYNGAVSSCAVLVRESKWIGGNDGGVVNNSHHLKDCNIDGITGKIYKPVEIGEGQDGLYDSIAFIMEDGSVEYFSLNDALRNSNFSIQGKLKIDGFVVDAFTVGVAEEGTIGGFGSTIFVLSDGSYIRYDESMLQ